MTAMWIGVLPAAIGFLLVRALACGARRYCLHDLFRLILGMGIGIGLCSECYFVGLAAGCSGLLLEILLLSAVGIVVTLYRRHAGCCFCEVAALRQGFKLRTRRLPRLTRMLGGALGLLLLLDLAVFVWVSAQTPRGGWDAWAIWNLRARFLYRAGGIAWRDGFTEVLAWSHPDYPLLLPAFVARGWKLLGRESSSIAIALGCFFTFGCAGVTTATLGILRGARQGILAGLALAATPFLYVQGAMQCADVPLAFFILATLACLAVADRFHSRGFAAIAGVAAALGGWTKNEGLLWFGALLLARAIVTHRRLMPSLLAGALPVLAPILFFKARIATASDVFGAAGRSGMMARALDPARYHLIAREAIRHVLSFGPLLFGGFAILAVYVAVAGLRRDKRDRDILRTGVLALSFTTLGYGAIYLLRPLDLGWLLGTSADRLLLQLWPGMVFVAFLACRAPRQSGSSVSMRTIRLEESLVS